MKVSINAVKELGGDELVSSPLNELIEKIDAQIGALESEPFRLGELYDNILVVRVVECLPHPNADNLHVCLIDDGQSHKSVERNKDGLIQVVCGAPNVKANMTAVWLPPGTVVPASRAKDPLTIEVREIRDLKSFGMLASPAELAISDNHDGLLEILPTEGAEAMPSPGTPFSQLYGLDDYIFEIENKMFTHRPDLFGQLGVAREVAGIQQKIFRSPDWYKTDTQLPTGGGLDLTVDNKLPELVPRFLAVAIKDVKIGTSPIWLQSWLSRLGLRPINNVVDLTNYYMLLSGQPLHAYDYDKVKQLSGGDKAMLVVRRPSDKEHLKLLNGKEIEPGSEAILIATDKQAIGLGGIMGGADTEVDAGTHNLILECATFDMFTIRRTAMSQGIFSDAVTRFTKGQSPLQNPAVISKATEDIVKLTGGQIASPTIDSNTLAPEVMARGSINQPVSVGASFINQRLGLNLPAAEMQKLLQNVEFKVELSDQTLNVQSPFWRTDVAVAEDVVEEVGRLSGYQALPEELPRRRLAPPTPNPLLELKSQLRQVLSAAGANEVLSYSFVHANLLQKASQDPAQAFELSNASSPSLQYYRLSLTPSLLELIHPNIKAGYNQFVLFEIGKGHNLKQKTADHGLPAEFEMLDVIFAATNKAELAGAAYYQALNYLNYLSNRLGLKIELKPVDAEEDYPVAKPYDYKRSAKVFVRGSDLPLGMIGEYKHSVRTAFKLPKYAAGFGLGLSQLLEALKTSHPTNYIPLPRFPKVMQDISLKVPAELSYGELASFLGGELTKLQPKSAISDLQPLDIYLSEDKSNEKHVAFRLIIADQQRTMTDAEVNSMLDQLAAAAKTKFGAERL